MEEEVELVLIVLFLKQPLYFKHFLVVLFLRLSEIEKN
jgi:hypothetical protein